MSRGWSRARRSSGILGLVALTLLASGCRGRSQSSSGDSGSSKKDHVAVIDLRGGVPESPVSGGLFPLPAQQTHVGLLRLLDKLRDDAKSKGIFVRVGGQSLPLAQSAEIGEALARITEKKVVCHAHGVDNATAALLLPGCDELWLSAAGDVSTVGIAAQSVYLKNALDKFGIEADMLALGRYKSGVEMFTREGPSEMAEKNLNDTLRDLRRVWLGAVTAGHPSAEELQKNLEDGPFSPEKAKERGLVTHVGFEDEALDSARQSAGTDDTKIVFGPGAEKSQGPGLAELVRLLAGAGDRSGGKPRVAVVPLTGSITVSGGGPFGESGITSDAAVRTLKRLREDAAVKAVVLRLDSPGGSPLASDLIWRQVMLTRKEKPVVVSIGSMAASGGYYIACAGTKIVASESAIVGSIGVFGGKIVLRKTFEGLGVTTHEFFAHPDPAAGARALHMSVLSPWDPPTRERVRESMQSIYDLFVARVSEGRALAKEAVYGTAEGEIFLAGVGKERGLVDEIGGVQRALELARELAGVPEEIAVVVEGPAESLFEALFLGSEPDSSELESALARFEERRQRAAAAFPDRALLEALRPFSAAVSPLLAGETVVAALPYALEIR